MLKMTISSVYLNVDSLTPSTVNQVSKGSNDCIKPYIKVSQNIKFKMFINFTLMAFHFDFHVDDNGTKCFNFCHHRLCNR